MKKQDEFNIMPLTNEEKLLENQLKEKRIYTQQELTDKCTPEIIKKMVELAEGFEIIFGTTDGIIAFSLKDSSRWYSKDSTVGFPLLIHRAVEGFNKQNEETGQFGIYIDREKIVYCIFKLDKNYEKAYKFKSYQPTTLTHAECAELHCLIEVFKEERK